jgi:hypothetical protein
MSAAYSPPGHGRQVVRPERFWWNPGGQMEQLAAPADALKKPNGHGVQTRSLLGVGALASVKPAAHAGACALQMVSTAAVPAVTMNWPAAHTECVWHSRSLVGVATMCSYSSATQTV